MDQLTRCAAVDLAPFGIRVNAVNPGVVITELQKRGGLTDEVYCSHGCFTIVGSVPAHKCRLLLVIFSSATFSLLTLPIRAAIQGLP